jgi:hypothetical protein
MNTAVRETFSALGEGAVSFSIADRRSSARGGEKPASGRLRGKLISLYAAVVSASAHACAERARLRVYDDRFPYEGQASVQAYGLDARIHVLRDVEVDPVYLREVNIVVGLLDGGPQAPRLRAPPGPCRSRGRSAPWSGNAPRRLHSAYDPRGQYGTYAEDLGEGGARGLHLGFDAPTQVADLSV